jgi:hypothetical protein
VSLGFSVSMLTVSAATNEILDKTREIARREIRLSCRKESHRPFTMNKAEYNKTKEGNVTAFAALRHRAPLSPAERTSFTLMDANGISRSYPATEENLLKVVAAFGFHLSSSKDLVRLNDDECQAELDVISHVVAYFDIASRRLIDEIPQVFETVFAREFGENLNKVLTTKLNLVGEKGLDNCARYIRDEPDIEAKRARLTRMRKILDKARETIERFYK